MHLMHMAGSGVWTPPWDMYSNSAWPTIREPLLHPDMLVKSLVVQKRSSAFIQRHTIVIMDHFSIPSFYNHPFSDTSTSHLYTWTNQKPHSHRVSSLALVIYMKEKCWNRTKDALVWVTYAHETFLFSRSYDEPVEGHITHHPSI